MLSEEEMHELETLAHLEEKDFNNNTCDKYYIDLVMNAGKKSFKIITKLQKENNRLKKYDYRNIKIDEQNKISSPSFTQEQLDLMNLGIALYVGIPKLLEDESEDNNI